MESKSPEAGLPHIHTQRRTVLTLSKFEPSCDRLKSTHPICHPNVPTPGDELLEKLHSYLVKSLCEYISEWIVCRGCHVMNVKLTSEALEHVAKESSSVVTYDASRNSKAVDDMVFHKHNYVGSLDFSKEDSFRLLLKVISDG